MSPASDGTVYRTSSRVALTTAGVAVIGTALPLLAAVLSSLVFGRLGWLFGIPLVAVAGYCAWEARPDARRATWVTPPLVTLLAVLVSVLVTEGIGSALTVGANIFRVLAGQAAPWLMAAELTVLAVALIRRRRPSTGQAR